MSSTETTTGLVRTSSEPVTTTVAVPSSVLASEASESIASAQASASAAASGVPSNLTSPSISSQEPIFACTPASYNWTGGNPPYTDLFLIQSSDVNANVLKTLPSETAPGQASWGVDILPGTSITFVIKDSFGMTGYSVPVVIQTGQTLNCIPGHKSNVAAIAGGVGGGVGGALVLGLFLWWFCWRPSRKQQRVKDSYGEGEEFGGKDEFALAPTAAALNSRNTIARMVPGTTAGSYNLNQLDFTEDSLEQIHRERIAGLPTYDDAQTSRRGNFQNSEREQVAEARRLSQR